jgi:hypothetical protein
MRFLISDGILLWNAIIRKDVRIVLRLHFHIRVRIMYLLSFGNISQALPYNDHLTEGISM